MDRVAVRRHVMDDRLVHDHRTVMDFAGQRGRGGQGGEGCSDE